MEERSVIAGWTPPRTGTDLARQLLAAVVDVPWFVASPLLRRSHLTWGATPATGPTAPGRGS